MADSGARRLLFRVDASRAIGTGHLMRCLSLADRLVGRGVESLFLCAEHDRTAAELVRGHRLEWLPGAPPLDAGAPRPPEGDAEAWAAAWAEDARSSRARIEAFAPDAVVVDHYRLDARWERAIRPPVIPLLVIDDLADRDHACDLLLDQNLYDAPRRRYAGRLPERCRALLGPDYALLRPEFRHQRSSMRPRDGRVRRIQLFFGGTDPTNETAKALRALAGLEGIEPEGIEPEGIELEVISGAANPHLDELRGLCARLPNARLAVQVNDMARRMSHADLAVGAVGAAYLERCAVGLPTLALITADNQREVAGVLARHGAIELLGECADHDEASLRRAVEGLLAAPERVAAMAERSAALMERWYRGGEEALVEALFAVEGGDDE